MVLVHTKFQLLLAKQAAVILAALLISLLFMSGFVHASRANGDDGGTGTCPNGVIVGTRADGTTFHYCR